MRKILYTSVYQHSPAEFKYNLAESTSENLSFREILSDELVADLRKDNAGYGTNAGNELLRALIAAKICLAPDNILTTSGAIGALHLAVFCLCDHGDEVITTIPGWAAAFDIIQSLGAKMKKLKIDFDTGYRLDIGRLKSIVGERTKLIILLSPHNPSGIVTPPDVVDSILEIMRVQSPNAYLLMDETFREANYGATSKSISAAGLSNRIITISSLSKAHGAPGLRLGWVTSTRPKLLEHLKIGKKRVAISCSVLDERLGVHILENAERILRKRNDGLRKALRLVENWVSENSAYMDWVKPDAGGMCCIRLRKSVYRNDSVEKFYQLTEKSKIMVATGDHFLDERRVFRLGFGALPRADLKIALEILEDNLRKTAKQVSP